MAYGGGGATEGKTNGFSTGGEEDSLDSLGSKDRRGGQACALLESAKRYISFCRPLQWSCTIVLDNIKKNPKCFLFLDAIACSPSC